MKSAHNTARDIVVLLTAVGLIIMLAGLGSHYGIDASVCLAIGGVGVTVILLGWVTKAGKAQKRDYSFEKRMSDFSKHPKSMAQSRNKNTRGLGAA